jgi:hypothetical protein
MIKTKLKQKLIIRELQELSKKRYKLIIVQWVMVKSLQLRRQNLGCRFNKELISLNGTKLKIWRIRHLSIR